MPIAMRNLKKISDAGIVIAAGTDSGGGPGRFQGYFEHLELEYETKAGLTRCRRWSPRPAAQPKA